MKQKFLLIAITFLLANIGHAATVLSNGGHYQASYSSDCTPALVTFTHLVAWPGATTKKINYNDGTPITNWPGTGGTINHTFSIAGTHDVYVEYYNGSIYIGGEYVRIEIYGQPGSVENVYGATAACPNDKVRMRVEQGWNPSSDFTYTWNWGDGSPLEVSEQNDLSHTYTAVGTYNITVTTTGGPCGGGPYTVSTGTMIIGTSVPLPPYISYSFYIPEEGICPNQEVYYSYPNEYASSYVQWGDGSYTTDGGHRHTYAATGNYYVSATITNGCGASYTHQDTIHVVGNLHWSPTAYYDIYNSSPICPGARVDLSSWTNGAVSQEWYNQDGVLVSTQNYFDSNDFMENDTLSLVLTNGCGYDTTLHTVVEVVSNIPVDANDFNNVLIPASVCTGSQFPYAGENFGEPESDLTYHWDFGDGTTSDNFSGVHEYSTNGSYTVTLVGINSCGMDTTLTFNVTAGGGVAPDPSTLNYFAPGDDGNPSACPNDSALFVGLYYIPDGTYSMDFGDGVISTTPQTLGTFGLTYLYFTHAYSALGVYATALTFTNSCGLSITKNMDITIGSNIPANGNAFYDEASNICLGDPINFHGFGASQFIWNFGDGTGNLVTTSVMDDVPHVYENPGSYTVTVQAVNGCGNSSEQEINIVIPDNRINITTNTIDANCGEADGKAISVITGGNPPYAINWSNGSDDILVDSLGSGIYVCNVTDQNGCYNFGIATVSDAEAPAIVVNTVVDVTCNGGHDGAIDINVIGSTGPYQFSWSNGSSSEDLSGLVAGPYEVYVTNAYGCTATASITVEEPDPVQISFIVTDASCGGDDGMIQASANGNSGPFTYVWSSGHIGATYTGLDYGIYEVNVIDSKGCVVTNSTTVDEDNGLGGPAIALVGISDLDCAGGGSTINISVFATTGTPSYSWSTGATTQDITVTAAGDYTVTVTDGSCHAIETFTVDHASPDAVPMCMVSVDSMYATNKVIWEKPVSSDIAYFKIYRESSSAGLYYHVGTRPYDSLSIFTDYVANPQIQSWRYKISTVDHCGAESALSAHHKTIHLNQNLGLIAGSVNLIWDDYEGFGYSTFNVLRYTQSTGYVNLAGVSALNHSYTDLSAPLTDSTLFYVITLDLADPCTSTRAQNNNTVRSNRSDNALAAPFNPDGIVENMATYAYSNVYPNPAGDNVTVEFEVVNPGDYTIQVVNAMGQQVVALPCGRIDLFCKKEISLNGFERGVYFVNIVSTEGKISKRIVKM